MATRAEPTLNAAALPLNLAEWESRACAGMERGAYDYFAGGACDERTLDANRAAYDRMLLKPRVLVDVSHLDPATTVLGTPLSFPVMLAPTAFQKLAHPDGERATARAAAAAGTIMVVSTVASTTLEDVAAASSGPKWFQLYVYKDRGLARALVERAESAGYRALVLTVDTPYLGRRERDVRNAFRLPDGIRQANFEADHPLLAGETPDADPASFSSYANTSLDPSLTWDTINWLRSSTRMPVLVKGLLAPEDALLAVRNGVQGIIVSNHGGRQLDGALPSVMALPEVIEVVAGAVPVLVDGGVRRGTDVLKALALGAHAVLIGRPFLWGLAVAGEGGVRAVLGQLREELELAMALCGRPTIAEIDRSVLAAKVASADF